MCHYSDGGAGVEDALAADEPLGPVHGDGAHHVLSQVLRDLEHEADAVVEHLERREDGREALIEPHVDDGADDLAHLADGAGAGELVGDLPRAGLPGGGGGRRGGGLGLRRRGGGVGGGAVEEVARRGRAVRGRAGERGRGGPADAGRRSEQGREGPARRHGRGSPETRAGSRVGLSLSRLAAAPLWERGREERGGGGE